MKNKLLLSTAIASVAFAGVASAETKIGGNLEQTFVSASQNDGIGSSRGFGAEHNISLSASKDLDNGMSMKYGTVLEDATTDTHYLTVGTDAVTVTVGRDNGNNLSSSSLPYIGDAVGTAVNQLGATTSNTTMNQDASPRPAADYHNEEHIRIDANVMGGTVTVGYAPDMSTSRPSDSAVNEGENSATAFIYSGSLGVDGLKVLVGTSKMDGEGTQKDAEEKQYGLSYNAGQFTVGVQKEKQKDDATDAAQIEKEIMGLAATYAVNDNLSVGLYSIETEKKIGGTKQDKDEEIKMVQIGYNLGGLGLSFGYAEVENVGNAAGGDEEQFQIRTIQKF
jgi:hypothetical protein